MRRCVVVLADLFVPRGADRVDGAAVEMPAFSEVLRFARGAAVADWRTRVISEFGASVGAQPQWRATPVALEARSDHVRLSDRGLIELSASERAELVREFAAAFAPDVELIATTGRDFLVRGLDGVAAMTADPARFLGADIRNALARGENSRRVRSLASEIELWLHGSALNAARRSRGEPEVSTLWLWTAPAIDAHPREGRATATAIVGTDPLLAQLADVGGATLENVTAGFASVAHCERVVAMVEPVSRAALVDCDRDWLMPALDAIRHGRLRELIVVANDVEFQLTRMALWRRWRPSSSWLQALRRA